MIVTITPNPSVDRTVFLDELNVGSVNRSRRSWSEPSGKGVNVALALHRHGVAVRAVLTAGGSVGAQLRQMLDAAGLDAVITPIDGEIRSNISLTQPDGTVTKINEAGPVLSDDEARRLVAAVEAQLPTASWLVCAGSLPAGISDGWYAPLVELGRRHRVPVAVDSSGPALAASLADRPALVKPNVHELGELVGRTLRTFGDVLDAADETRDRGADTVLASLGADGAILRDADGALHGRISVQRVVSTVGAGDAMLAGYLSSADERSQALAAALAWGAAAVQHEGTLFGPTVAPTSVDITDRIDRERALSDPESAATSSSEQLSIQT